MEVGSAVLHIYCFGLFCDLLNESGMFSQKNYGSQAIFGKVHHSSLWFTGGPMQNSFMNPLRLKYFNYFVPHLFFQPVHDVSLFLDLLAFVMMSDRV